MLEVKIANSSEEKNLAYNLRYKVFCEELGYIDKDKFPDNLEKDDYDDLETTISLIAILDGTPVAAARLLTPNKKIAKQRSIDFGLPMENLFSLSCYKERGINVSEISRSSVLNDYRGKLNIMKLWKLAVHYSLANGMPHMCTCAGTETDCFEDAITITEIARNKKLFHPWIYTKAKVNSIPSPTPLFRLYGNNPPGEEEIPQTLQLYIRLGLRFTGEPVYYPKFRMCTIPMNWDLKNISKPFKSFFEKS